VVCPGTYYEQVVVAKPLTLTGQRATIDGTGVAPTLQLNVPNTGAETMYAGVVVLSSHVRFSGFTVTDAQGEGILAMGGLTGEISDITITGNRFVHNDQGFGVATGYYFCQPPGFGDCGETVHFTGVADSTIVTGNSTDCGVTLPGHNPGALSATGQPQPQPSVAGVYGNVIRDNLVTNNGVPGEGGGVLFANASSGTASYHNLVQGNYFAGNGLAGVTFHAHVIASGQFEDLSGNQVIGNVFGQNNLDGHGLDYPPYPPTDLVTTGILVYSGGTPVTVTSPVTTSRTTRSGSG
jgi:nitrous oxidase accessory protein NosD